MGDKALERLRAICLALPESEEKAGVGDPTFKVRDKIFAMRHPFDGRPSMWCKASPGFQDIIVQSEPQRFFVPPYVGQHGWIGAWLDIDLDWDFVAHLIEDSYRRTAPKRLCKLLDEERKKTEPKK